MARSLAVTLLFAVLLHSSFQLLLPPQLVAEAAGGTPMRLIYRLTIKARPWAKKEAADYVKKKIRRRVEDAITNWGNPQQQQLGAAAATGPADALVIDFSVGHAPAAARNTSGLVDITSQLVWVQCAPCAAGGGGACLPPPETTSTRLPCASHMCPSFLRETCNASLCDGYTATYGPYANASGYLATDTFTFDSTTAVPAVVFGCSNRISGDFSGASGVIGLGRGPLSLLSQLNLTRFSYQLSAPQSSSSSSDEDGSVIRFGDDAIPMTNRHRSTPLLVVSQYPNLYYVKLTGILVDGNMLSSIPAGTFDLTANGSGGVILSTTMPVTFLEEAAYNVVKQALKKKIALPTVDGSELDLDLCYLAASMANKSVVVPTVTLVFDGVGAEMNLSSTNLFFIDDDTGLECLTMLPSRGGSVLGSLLQTGNHMIYDVGGERLTFERTAGLAPPLPAVSLMVILVPLVASLLLF
uniref:Peptidase A1 domain-containing protein n=1 Tax=Oryza meridionalis TaxID=40149 RepID=A0A0E0FBX3_9ORYZ